MFRNGNDFNYTFRLAYKQSAVLYVDAKGINTAMAGLK